MNSFTDPHNGWMNTITAAKIGTKKYTAIRISEIKIYSFLKIDIRQALNKHLKISMCAWFEWNKNLQSHKRLNTDNNNVEYLKTKTEEWTKSDQGHWTLYT